MRSERGCTRGRDVVAAAAAPRVRSDSAPLLVPLAMRPEYPGAFVAACAAPTVALIASGGATAPQAATPPVVVYQSSRVGT
ncbi:unnamed protein product [Lampetra fluviatilis]